MKKESLNPQSSHIYTCSLRDGEGLSPVRKSNPAFDERRPYQGERALIEPIFGPTILELGFGDGQKRALVVGGKDKKPV